MAATPEYSLVLDHVVFHIGDRSFEEAAAIPMAYYMALIGLFGMLEMPTMWQNRAQNHTRKEGTTPLIIYGASGAVGSAAVQLAQSAYLHPLICIAGASGKAVVEPLIETSKGDALIEHRVGAEKVVEQMINALRGYELCCAFDCVSEKGSSEIICQVLRPGGKISLVLPSGVKDVPSGFETSTTMVGSLWAEFNNKSGTHGAMGFDGGREFGYCYSAMIGHWFREGRLHVHKPEVVEGGLLGVEKALKSLREGKNRGVKYVVRVAETPGLISAEPAPGQSDVGVERMTRPIDSSRYVTAMHEFWSGVSNECLAVSCSKTNSQQQHHTIQQHSPTIKMSGNSSVGSGGVYEAGDQRTKKDSEINAEKEEARFHEGKEHSHKANDAKDERSIANKLERESKRENEPEKKLDVEALQYKQDATLPARSHGNEPSKGAKIDQELREEEEEILKKKGSFGPSQ
ncbi:hypothetical protein LTS10_003743 [Elasticomyces elasticus]|nr:hypothetical protein LTS10_003743 [Elasticomyces elasticus]